MDPPPATDSAVSSPRSAAGGGGGGRLRLMCSFGGHIVPRPHDKSLCYVGGETRIIVADRDSSLADLTARISKTLLGGCGFGLKYQLPNEDLDSLISVTTDEDLENMIDEFDRAASSPKPSRLRVFLFPSSPDSSQSQSSIGQLKSETWFLSALNGAVSADRDRGFSDSASVNSLLGLGDDPISNDGAAARSGGDASSQARDLASGKGSRQGGQDVHSVPDSPMLETSSSFGSTSSSPSLANLPPIRVHAAEEGGERQDRRLGIEEQFAQIGVSGGHKQEEGFVAMSSPPPMPTTLAAAAMSSGLVAGEYVNRVILDDERSEHGGPVEYRKHPTQQLQAQPQQRPSAGFDSASPDSVSSDSSIANALSRAKPAIYQEQLVQLPSGTGRVDASANPVDPNARVLFQDPGYILQHQFDPQQQQFIHAGAHYIQHHPRGAPIPAYYPMYAPQQHHPQLDQQYPVYYMPARPGQAPSPAMVQQPPPPAYAAARSPLKPEMAAAGMYRTTGTPAVVQAPPSQHQQQFVGFSHMQYPSQSVASVAPATSSPASYAYEYPETAHPSIYYTQPLAPTMSPAQYQTMTTGAAAVSSLPDGPNDAIKQQQVRTSQPI